MSPSTLNSQPSTLNASAPLPPFFRRTDWLTFLLTFAGVWTGYFVTLAPEVTLEDSGELATAAFYAGVSHPPGYPVWTLYSWLWTVLLPIKNIAWRVAMGEAAAGAFAAGLLALLVSRGSSLLIQNTESLKAIPSRSEKRICIASGLIAGLLLGFNGFLWSQAVIVEVYAFSVASFMLVLLFLLRWIYAPHQRRYFYLGLFFHGICFTNHQTLIVAALGIEVTIALADFRIGRNLFLGNSIIYLAGLILKSQHLLTLLEANPAVFTIFNVIGICSIVAYGWFAFLTRELALEFCVDGALAAFVLLLAAVASEGDVLLLLPLGPLAALIKFARDARHLGREWLVVLLCGLVWLLGASFYFYMPLASTTNPPMNWGYTRTVEGFIHALTRGQYEATHPTNIFGDPKRFLTQLGMLTSGIAEEFNWPCLLLALAPFFFLRKMHRRERTWLLGLTAIYLFMSVLLMILLNPASDHQTGQMVRVFFAASHSVVALMIGYGVVLILASLCLRARGAGKVLFPIAFVLFAFLPFYSIFSHWSDNEQRGHWFGYWYGHDMFKPPFTRSDGEPLYPEMPRNAVIFGGSDPGLFCPTYMIFCESFLPRRCKPDADQNFDRRDVHIITQTGLAETTYLDTIRAQYNRSAQIDPPFFQELLRSSAERKENYTNGLARAFAAVDRALAAFGTRVEKRRRAAEVYPRHEIAVPSLEDRQRCYYEYLDDVKRRIQMDPPQVKPGEDVRFINGELNVFGPAGVTSINALLAKVMFDANPTNEFFVEERSPLDWMYPQLMPYGIIVKLERQPLAELSQEIVATDHEFWVQYSKRLIGDLVHYDTPLKDITAFAEKVFLRRNYKGFDGNRKFIRDDQAQIVFSRARCAIAGIYAWRSSETNSPDAFVRQRMIKEADFAFRQAFAFCPYNTQTAFRYVDFLVDLNRVEDAVMITLTCQRFDPHNKEVANVLQRLRSLK